MAAREAKHELHKTAGPAAALQSQFVLTVLQKRTVVDGDFSSPRKFNTFISGVQESWGTLHLKLEAHRLQSPTMPRIQPLGKGVISTRKESRASHRVH